MTEAALIAKQLVLVLVAFTVYEPAVATEYTLLEDGPLTPVVLLYQV